MQSISCYCPKKNGQSHFSAAGGAPVLYWMSIFAFESTQMNYIAPCCAFLRARWKSNVQHSGSRDVTGKRCLSAFLCVSQHGPLCLLLKQLNMWRWYHWGKTCSTGFRVSVPVLSPLLLHLPPFPVSPTSQGAACIFPWQSEVLL